MSKWTTKTPHPHTWLWEQLERILPRDYFKQLREDYGTVLRAYALELAREHYKGSMPEDVRAAIERQLSDIKLPQAITILEDLVQEEYRSLEEEAIKNEQGSASDLLPGNPTSCGNCKRVSNHDEDWLCYSCRGKTEDIVARLREEGPRRALVPKAKQVIMQAYAYIQFVDAFDDGWADILRVKQFHAKQDHAMLNKLVRRSGRPPDPMYDEAHRLMSELGYSKKRAIEQVRATYPEAAKVSDEQFMEVLKKRKRSF